LKLIVPVKVEADLRSSFVLRKSSGVEVAVPAGMVDGECWGEKAFLYALDRMSLGVSSRKESKWREYSLCMAEVSVRKEGDAFVVRIPESVSRFYRLYMSGYGVSASPKGNKVIVSVGDIHLLQRNIPTG
ncbi:MAG: hypothetical protein QMD23_07565, partial [Candidatus Bathyarchaeia archaeon]|nr:hypothetical protein [Candidatus Bathyarchaeia archaeon]